MSVDPILPLSISIAEGERTYAFFLGSGISNTAGIPTGEQLLHETIKLLYKMENENSGVEDEKILAWFRESKYGNWGYSEILEELYPSKEDRRNYLEKIFLGKNPTESHQIIADMVEKKLVKVIVTTNFDKLMEQALDKKGIAYDVVASRNDLMELKPREHSNCRILKLHGDYQKFNIKNTKEELASLEDTVANEFKEILNNYGIVVIGYGGLDNGVMNCFEGRNNIRYTLYWVARENVNENVEELIRQQSGKKIVRTSADRFFRDLLQKIDIYQTHPTGETPEFLIQEIMEYLRNNDYISLNEALKKQKNEIEKKYYEITRKTDEIYKSHEDFEPHTDAKIIPLHEKPKINKSPEIPINEFVEFEKYVDILTAMGLVLIEYGNINYFKTLLKYLNEIYDLPPVEGADLKVSSISKAAIHNVYYQWGAYALKNEKFSVLKELLCYKIIINDLSYSKIESKEIWLLLSGKNIVTFDRNSPTVFNYLKKSYKQRVFLKQFFKNYDDYLRYLYQFNFILCFYSIKKSDRIVYPHILHLDEEYIRIYIEPLLFKIKTDFEFNYSISDIFNDLENTKDGKIPVFIANFPERCNKLNSIPIKTNWLEFGYINCNYFEE